MKLFFDDVTYFITDDNMEEIQCLNRWEFGEVVEILLTSNQLVNYIEITKREFSVGPNRLMKAKAYINSETNVWRKQKKK